MYFVGIGGISFAIEKQEETGKQTVYSLQSTGPMFWKWGLLKFIN